MLNTVAYGFYPNGEGVALAVNGEEGMIVHPKKVIMATGASENPLAFPGWTLPGVVGAGAIQTMINVHRVSVGQRVLMIGSGNVGLIVTYQLLQAGIDVAGIVEAAPQLGGYGVHAGKVRRAGVPLYVGHTVLEAVPNEDMSGVKGAIIVEVDNKFQPIPGTEQFVECDVIGIAVGLTPDIALPSMADVTLINAGRLGSQVPMHDRNMETTKEGIYVAGDSSGVEEASSAIEERKLAGIAEAEAMEKKALAYQKYNNAAMAEMLIQVLPEIAGKIAEPLTQIDKITIIGGDGGNGVGNVADNVPSVMAKLFETMKETVGIDLADIVKAGTYDAKVNKNINVTGLSGDDKKDVVAAVSGAVVSEAAENNESI